MSKLFKLRKWLTVPEAAKHLSGVFEEEVTEADVLRLGLDKHLRLSVSFVNGAHARRGYRSAELQRRIFDEDYEPPSLSYVFYTSEFEVAPLGAVSTINGIWELPMKYGERRDIENRYQSLIGGPPVSTNANDRIIVESLDGEICEIHSSSSTQEAFPASGLPEDSVLVVRTAALSEFEQSINGTGPGSLKPLATTERNTLLAIIAALCDYSAIKYQERGAASQITKLTEDIGAPVSHDSVRRVLEKIPDALERRMK